ncbi:class I SAM-dependent methyltransferase [Sandarakinorhabdus rubra]|uniref:class I SAM-dependent methyltransferase n=1 Tax=Sandarakinorhabdus rubra TaxID=2672568 RepID=UPI002E2A5BD6|nr:SAM-dependent methyltransferase [Sandarakinorhabdus rubra]
MTLASALAQRIAAEGPLRLDAWMAACNAAYYAGDDPLGRDFTTAPEISQMFGEIIGGWIGDLWLRAGKPAFHLVELGPGHGTLLADALRLLGRLPGLADAMALHLVETSLPLRSIQRSRLAGWPAAWHEQVDQLPADRPLIVIANEFFDALPIRQRRAGRELFVGLADGLFHPVWQDSPGEDAEWSEASLAIASQLAERLKAQGGACLVIDYGHGGAADGSAPDTLQAVHRGEMVSPFLDPGTHDLTAHVDFGALARAAHGLAVHGPVAQGAFLGQLGIAARAEALKAGKAPAEAAAITAAHLRLTAPQQMGALFQAMALVAPGWPVPAGFGMDGA